MRMQRYVPTVKDLAVRTIGIPDDVAKKLIASGLMVLTNYDRWLNSGLGRKYMESRHNGN